MIWPDVLFVFILALLFTLLVTGPFRWRYSRAGGVWPAAGFLFLIFLAVIWAAGIWSVPYGPALWSVYWLPFVLAGLFLALIILAITAAVRPPPTTAESDSAEAGFAALFGIFFWILILGSVAAIAVAYAR